MSHRCVCTCLNGRHVKVGKNRQVYRIINHSPLQYVAALDDQITQLEKFDRWVTFLVYQHIRGCGVFRLALHLNTQCKPWPPQFIPSEGKSPPWSTTKWGRGKFFTILRVLCSDFLWIHKDNIWKGVSGVKNHMHITYSTHLSAPVEVLTQTKVVREMSTFKCFTHTHTHSLTHTHTHSLTHSHTHTHTHTHI